MVFTFTSMTLAPWCYDVWCCFIRDRFRTLTNVTGDSLGAGIVYELSKHELGPLVHDGYEMAPTLDTSGKVVVPNGKDNTMTAV